MDLLLGSSSKKTPSITPKLRTQIWETYMGVGVRSDVCPLCGVNQIQNFQSNSGFQACHVVADKWALKELNVYYLYPGKFCFESATRGIRRRKRRRNLDALSSVRVRLVLSFFVGRVRLLLAIARRKLTQAVPPATTNVVTSVYSTFYLPEAVLISSAP